MARATVDRPALRFENVWKRFELEPDDQRSLRYLPMNLLRARRPKQYSWPLRNVSFDIPWGSTVGIIGENGSGKSTILKLICRILRPTSGVVEVFGRVSALLELGSGFHPELTGRENVYMAASIANLPGSHVKRHMDEIIDFADIGPYFDVPVKHYSSGMYLRLGFAVAVQLRPQVLLLDEVLAVGDEAFQHKCMQTIKSLQQQGTTLLIVSHGMEQVAEMCDSAIWLHNGRICSTGPAPLVIKDYMEASSAKEQERRTEKLAAQPADTETVSLQRYERGAPSPDAYRWGNGDVQIERVHLIGPGNRIASVVEAGQSIRIEFDYRIKRTLSDFPAFGVAIYRFDGVWCYGSNTTIDSVRFEQKELPGLGTVTIELPDFPLLHGDYSLDVAVHAAREDITYDYIRDALHFRVRNPKSDQGIFRPKLNWSLADREERTTL
jgi:ABC-type polysaccharide/polyol phosphate transport system ATPase subunit